MQQGPGHVGGARPWWPVWVVVLAAALPACWAIFTDQMGGRGAYDQWNFHEPMIRRFIAEWPRLNLENPLSATTPLYHVLLAGASFVVGESDTALRLVSLGILLVLLAGVVRLCQGRGARLAEAMAAGLAFGASMYVWPSGVWLLPDNLGWAGVVAMLAIALRPEPRVGVLVAGGAVCALLVLTRQIHVWTAGLLWVSAWVGSEVREDALGRRELLPVGPLFTHLRERVLRATVAVKCTLPAILLLVPFAMLWHGLVAPRFQGQYAGTSAVTPAFHLMMLAIISAPFAGWLVPGLRKALREHAGALVVAAGIGLILALIGDSSWKEEVRSGHVWEVIKRAPVIGGRISVVALVLAPAGAVALVGWLARLELRERWIMLAAMAGFVAAQSASPQVWPRYHEPFVLLWVGVAACRGREAPVWRWAVVGPLALALAFAGLNALRMRGGRADQDRRNPLTSPNYWGPPTPMPREWTEEAFPRRW